MRKTMIVLLAVLVAVGVLAVPQKSAIASPAAAASQAAPKEDRVSGTIVRQNKDKSTLTVREQRSKIERTVFYNASTKWTKGKGEPTDMKEFKDGSRVICLGKLNEKGELTATRIDLQQK
jgi:Ni/Co efflux regulator RcnB